MKLTDQLIARLRKAPMRDDDELRDSLKNWGWLPQLPAIMDERGQVLVGNRRLRLASELTRGAWRWRSPPTWAARR